tara:strand:- start:298 stop:1356 length:1059 start_codon:yes stop_codon:yes gene_type:complete
LLGQAILIELVYVLKVFRFELPLILGHLFARDSVRLRGLEHWHDRLRACDLRDDRQVSPHLGIVVRIDTIWEFLLKRALESELPTTLVLFFERRTVPNRVHRIAGSSSRVTRTREPGEFANPRRNARTPEQARNQVSLRSLVRSRDRFARNRCARIYLSKYIDARHHKLLLLEQSAEPGSESPEPFADVIERTTQTTEHWSERLKNRLANTVRERSHHRDALEVATELLGESTAPGLSGPSRNRLLTSGVLSLLCCRSRLSTFEIAFKTITCLVSPRRSVGNRLPKTSKGSKVWIRSRRILLIVAWGQTGLIELRKVPIQIVLPKTRASLVPKFRKGLFPRPGELLNRTQET